MTVTEPNTSPPPTPSGVETTEVVGHTDDLAVGQMKLTRVGEHRVALIRTPSGIHALDNACPHQGYGLVTGSLDGELVTCQWHNWKFRAADGTCLIGEEDVACHRVEIADDGAIEVTVVDPTPETARAQLWPSLDRGFDNNYSGQMARDTVRLLHNGATPAEIVARELVRSQGREDYGVGHGLAMATDCLALADLYPGDQAALPTVQALSAMAEPTRFRPTVDLAVPDPTADLAVAIEAEDVAAAVGATLAMIEAGAAPADLLAAYADAVSQHHLSYGHGAIYVQKCFEMLDLIGWNHAPDLLPHLTISLTYATREDTLPYMRKAFAEIQAADIDALAAAAVDPTWSGRDELVAALTDSPQAAIAAAIDAAHAGAGVIGLIDAVTLAVSERLLGYDLAVDFDPKIEFGWLDITHGLTYANAARWLWERRPGPQAARLALHTVFLCHDTGRAQRWEVYQPQPVPEPAGKFDADDFSSAVLHGHADRAVAIALAAGPDDLRLLGETLARCSLADRSASWIVTAHVVKLAQAARIEADAIGSAVPLAAAARFAAAPRLERFVARNVAAAIDFVTTGSPPRR